MEWTESGDHERGGGVMKCLDHIDMGVMAGAVTVVASAVFFFAFLGVEREPLVLPEPVRSAAFLQEQLEKTINEAVVTPARVAEERERAQAALGEAIVRLGQVQARETAFIPDLAKSAAASAQGRREFLEGVFKLPLDWRGAEFLAMERQAEAMAQQDLGRMIALGGTALMSEIGAAEAEYERALLAATLTLEREAIEPTASQATIVAAVRAMAYLAERTAPAPAITRDSSWGFGSIGDGTFIPIIVLGAGAMLLLAAGAGMREGRWSTHTMEAHCDEHRADVVVEMLVSDDTPYEVAHCSAFDGGPVTCDKRCLKWPVAHAA